MLNVVHEMWRRPHAVVWLGGITIADHVWVLCYQGNALVPVVRVFHEVERATVTP